MAAPIYQILTGVVNAVKTDLVTITFNTIYKNVNESTRDISKVYYYNRKSILSSTLANLQPGASVKLYRIFRQGKPRDDIFSFFPAGKQDIKLLEHKPTPQVTSEPLMEERPFEPSYEVKKYSYNDDDDDGYISVDNTIIIEDTVFENA